MPKYPFLEFVASVGTWDFDGEAYLDSGFEGGLAIPARLEEEILADADLARLRLANFEVVEVPSWPGTVEVSGHSFRLLVVALGNRFLLGRELMDQVEACFCYGREVRLHFRGEVAKD